ncbi:MAG: TIGR04282 family arsenosugar biosynthesis glycosyltransferase [Pontibacterium sp.]
MKTVRLIVFAKAPLPGFAKTRLIPALGEVGAADLARQLLKHTVLQAVAADIGPVELCVTPDTQDPVWQQLADETGDAFTLTVQTEGDLGQRMGQAMKRVIDEGQSVLLVGTDCPLLNAERLRLMAAALSNHDCALYPVDDGGYVALALNQFDEAVFSDIPWSTDQVAALTRRNIARLNWSLWQGESLYDIDEADDLRRLQADQRSGVVTLCC